MPEMSISLLAITMAVGTQFLWGLVWYGIFFRRRWAKEMVIDPDVKPGKQYIYKGMGLMLVGNLLMVWVLVYTIAAWNPVSWGLEESAYSPLARAAMAAFFNWLGFVVPILLSAVAWGGKSWPLFAINGVYYLVGLFVMAAILIYF